MTPVKQPKKTPVDKKDAPHEAAVVAEPDGKVAEKPDAPSVESDKQTVIDDMF